MLLRSVTTIRVVVLVFATLLTTTLLVFVAPCVAVAVTIVRNCTTLAPGTFVFKKNQLMDASLEGAA